MEQLRARVQVLGIRPEVPDAPLSEDEIRDLESLFGAVLPDDYRWFLSQYGASSSELWLVCPIEGGGLCSNDFFGRQLAAEYTHYSDEVLPDGFIPISEDGGGNIMCMSLRPESYGHVYFHHHCWGIGSEPDSFEARMETLLYVVDSFTAYLERLVIELD